MELSDREKKSDAYDVLLTKFRRISKHKTLAESDCSPLLVLPSGIVWVMS
jgi:hypothetical protein